MSSSDQTLEISFISNYLNGKIGHIFPYLPIVFSVLSENDCEVENQVELVSSLQSLVFVGSSLGSQFDEMQILYLVDDSTTNN